MRTDNGWYDSADAWITDPGEHGDFGRPHVLDPVMVPRVVVNVTGGQAATGLPFESQRTGTACGGAKT